MHVEMHVSTGEKFAGLLTDHYPVRGDFEARFTIHRGHTRVTYVGHDPKLNKAMLAALQAFVDGQIDTVQVVNLYTNPNVLYFDPRFPEDLREVVQQAIDLKLGLQTKLK